MHRLHRTDTYERTRGFTLVEMMVAVGLFAVVMTISVGALLSLVDADKKAQALKSVMNNLNFALENMSRNMRVGTHYHCSTSASVPPGIDSANDCVNGGVLLGFEGHSGDPTTSTDQIVYRFNAGKIEKSDDGGASFIAITAPEVTIEDMKFYVTGTPAGDGKQPRIVMTVKGSAGISLRAQTAFNLQTSISQRLTDL